MNNAHTFAQVVALNLRSRRLALGLNRAQLAKSSKIGRSTIVRIEDGAFSPQVATLWSLAKALNCKVSDLVTQPKPASAEADQ